MLTAKDINELKRRIAPERCSINRMAGVYVDTEKNKVMYINEQFLTIDESIFLKLLSIIRDVFSNKVNDNMLSVPIEGADTQRVLESIIDDGLKSSPMLDCLYDRIIEWYTYPGNYLILLWEDAYDVPKMGKDGIIQDVSEEVYQHIICAVCPVELTAAGLKYDPDTKAIGVRIRDWAVCRPACGFVYPAFEERTVETDKVMFYTASPKEPQHALMEAGLELQGIKTISEIRTGFERVIAKALGGTEEAKRQMPYICEQLYLKVLDDPEHILTAAGLEEACKYAAMDEYVTEIIKRVFVEDMGKDLIKTEWLLNKRMVERVEEMREKEHWKSKCKEAARTIASLAGEETKLSKELSELAGRK